jgi:hypothetical protein
MHVLKNPLLTRYWIEFAPPEGDRPWHTCWPPGKCGVTALSYEDALQLLQEHVFVDTPLPKIQRVVEGVDLSLPEFDRVRPWLGAPMWRSVWYPFYGYEYWRPDVQRSLRRSASR